MKREYGPRYLANSSDSTNGYDTETRMMDRFGDGFGNTETKLPKGHLARRDTRPVVKRTDGK